jgi:hypothetical protein
MRVVLSPDDARFLRAQLTAHLQEIEGELVHTDARSMQREIADDARRLRELIDRLTPLAGADHAPHTPAQ